MHRQKMLPKRTGKEPLEKIDRDGDDHAIKHQNALNDKTSKQIVRLENAHA
jgi:hypothetical protein